MKKLTKKSLEELAQVMPVLSEVEMRECVGGDIVYINADGVFLRKENNPTVNEVRIEGTSFYKTLPEGTYVQTFMYDYEAEGESGAMERRQGSGIMFMCSGSGSYEEQKAFFESLARNTNSEWGWAHDNAGKDPNAQMNSMIFSTNDSNSLDSTIFLEQASEYNAFYHSHPRDANVDPNPSDPDRNVKNNLIDNFGYDTKNIGTYDAKTNS